MAAAPLAPPPQAGDGRAACQRHRTRTRRRRRSPRPFAAQVKAARLATNLRPQLLTRQEVVALVGLTYPSIWLMMREGRFPRSRVVGGKSMWVSGEIDAWVDALPLRPLKPLDEVRA